MRACLEVGDFGISKQLLSEDDVAASMVGTPYNMAPEIFKGQPYDERCDIFSAGCVLHELCTLKRTFQATNICAIMTRVLNAHIDPLDPTLYTPALSELVAAMLAGSPEDRPTAAELLTRPIFADNQHRWKHQV
jgi:NIMA (never in mitosis gene a)-related kinase